MTTEEFMAAILAELRLIRADLADRTPAESSVEISTSARGNDIKVKAYPGSSTEAAADSAVNNYVRVVADLNNKLAGALNGGGRP